MVHLMPVNTKITASELLWIYIKEICRLHGLPSSIVSDRDLKFTSKWWREVHQLLGAKLLMSTSFHPQTDGQMEWINCSVAQIFCAAIKPDQLDWVLKAPMVEFIINASINETTGYAPFEAIYGFMPSMIQCVNPDTSTPLGVKEFAELALQNVVDMQDAIIAQCVFQKHYAN